MPKVKVSDKMSVVDHLEECPLIDKTRKTFKWYQFMSSEATPKCPECKGIVTHETVTTEFELPQRAGMVFTDSAKLTRSN